MLQCRTIFPGFDEEHSAIRVLRSDYSVVCDDALHQAHCVVAYGFIGIAVLLPAAVIAHLRPIATAGSSIAHRVSTELAVSPVDAQEAITNLLTARPYSFLTAGHSSRFPWWEAVDIWVVISKEVLAN